MKDYLQSLLYTIGVIKNKNIVLGVDKSNGIDKSCKVTGYKDKEGNITITKIDYV